MGMTVRWLHARTLLLFGLPWMITALTGVLHNVLCYSLGYPRASLRILMQLHQMSFFPVTKKVYPLIVGLSLLVQIALGLVLLVRRIRQYPLTVSMSSRSVHTILALIAAPIVLITALAGTMYRLNSSWLGDKVAARWWIQLSCTRKEKKMNVLFLTSSLTACIPVTCLDFKVCGHHLLVFP
jgi:hypothetical protein